MVLVDCWFKSTIPKEPSVPGVAKTAGLSIGHSQGIENERLTVRQQLGRPQNVGYSLRAVTNCRTPPGLATGRPFRLIMCQGALDPLRVYQQGEQKEEHAEHILAFGNPRNGFHPKRVPCKQRRNESSSPQRMGQPKDEKSQKARIDRVNQDTHQVVRPGLSPKSSQSSMCESHVTGCQLLA